MLTPIPDFTFPFSIQLARKKETNNEVVCFPDLCMHYNRGGGKKKKKRGIVVLLLDFTTCVSS